MQKKWYIGTLLFILAFLGISQHQISEHNQEIVVRFADNVGSFDQAQVAIESVKEQLRNVGVEDVRVSKDANGRLKITYFSDVDVAFIKNIFANYKGFALGVHVNDERDAPFQIPSEENKATFKIDVSEIKNGSDVNKDFNGFLLEPNPENDRFTNPIQLSVVGTNDYFGNNTAYHTAFLVQHHIALTFDTFLYQIPEVRAGPLS